MSGDFPTPGESASDDLKKFVSVFALYAEKTDAAAAMRKKGFKDADPNGNGLCSLSEIETFVLKALMAKFPKAGGLEPGRDLWDAFRPCYIRAYNDAKDFKKDDGEVLEGTKDSTSSDFVTFGEFRICCAYLCVYATMFDAFAKVDGGGEGRDKNDDRRIELAEWLGGYQGCTDYGFACLKGVKTEKQAEDIFRVMDSDGAGMVLLAEWCDFIKAEEIKAASDIGKLLAEEDTGSGAKAVAAKAVAEPNSFGLAVGKGKKTGASKEFFDFQSVFEPMCAETAAGDALREEGWKAADMNGNGLCSLAELETFVLKSLITKFPKTGKGKEMQEPGQDLFKAFRPCYIRAHTDAKDYKADTGDVIAGTKNATDDDFVSKEEFRLFCVYVVVYAAMFDAFAKIDGGGGGRDAGDDKRIELKEWMEGYKNVSDYGFVALQGIERNKDAKEIFNAKIDDNGGGIVLLDEWCEFIKAAEVKANTTVGQLLAADEAGGTGKNFKLAGAAKVLGKGVKGKLPKPGAKGEKKPAGAEGVSLPKKKAADKPPPPPKIPVAPNSFGLAVGKGRGGASKDFFQFSDCFEPMSADTPEGAALREVGWKDADMNGNGLCSLAELETFVLKTLVSKYPKLGKGVPGVSMFEPGKDLFSAYRPCYIRAYTDAKDYKADTGKVIKGTKKATDDDFVSVEEFRLFCVYLIVYAAMFDAFAKIDGGGAGRDAGDDKRIELTEWLNGYKNVPDYGFLALANINTKAEAKEVFNAKIDDNGGGIVLLDEWCEFIKAAEVKANTTVGQLLAADEAGGTGKKLELTGAAKVLGKGVGGKPTSPEKKSAKPPPPAKTPAGASNSFGLAVGKGKKSGASKEFFDFQSVFEPMCAETAAGDALREEGWKAADMNGNGLCSLAELETFVLKSLITKFPKTGKGKQVQEPGQDLFKAFRPCYIRSYTDAKDYKADTGTVIKGTKNATDDDFVSKEEFRFFCVYLIVYAAMFDAFAKIDGGGGGRDAGDDKRIELKEFLKGFKTVSDYGFVALGNINTKAEATEVFNAKIDDNGGGIVLLDEWCEFIKVAEVKANTTVGQLLAADEAGGTGKNFKLAGAAKVLGKGVKGKLPKPGAKGEKNGKRDAKNSKADTQATIHQTPSGSPMRSKF